MVVNTGRFPHRRKWHLIKKKQKTKTNAGQGGNEDLLRKKGQQKDF